MKDQIDWSSESISSITNMSHILGRLTRLGLYDTIDITIAGMPCKTASSTMMAAVLRHTNRWHPPFIPSREITLNAVYIELTRRGEDPEQILEGLLDN